MNKLFSSRIHKRNLFYLFSSHFSLFFLFPLCYFFLLLFYTVSISNRYQFTTIGFISFTSHPAIIRYTHINFLYISHLLHQYHSLLFDDDSIYIFYLNQQQVIQNNHIHIRHRQQKAKKMNEIKIKIVTLFMFYGLIWKLERGNGKWTYTYLDITKVHCAED